MPISFLTRLQYLDKSYAKRLFKPFDKQPVRQIIEYYCLTADGFTWLLGIPILIYLLPQRKELFFSMLYIGIFVDIIVTGSLKTIIRRNRPSHNKDDKTFFGPDNHSFPSGHTTRAFFVSVYTGIVLGGFYWLLLIWAFFTGLARIALGRHYPSDVLSGAIIGSIVGFILGIYFNLANLFLVKFLVTFL